MLRNREQQPPEHHFNITMLGKYARKFSCGHGARINLHLLRRVLDLTVGGAQEYLSSPAFRGMNAGCTHPHSLSSTFTTFTSRASTAVFNLNGHRGSKPLRSIFRIMYTWLKRWTILTPSYMRVLVINQTDNLLTEATVSPRTSFLSLSPPRFRLFPANHGETDY